MPRLLDEVERGETFIITRHGRAVARIAPEGDEKREAIRKIIEEMKEALTCRACDGSSYAIR